MTIKPRRWRCQKKKVNTVSTLFILSPPMANIIDTPVIEKAARFLREITAMLKHECRFMKGILYLTLSTSDLEAKGEMQKESGWMGQASQQRCICLAGGGGMTHPRKVRKKCQRVHLDCKICIFNYVNSLFFRFFWIIYPFLLLFCHFQSFIFVIFLLQLSPDIFLKGLRKRFKKTMPSSVSSFPGNRFFVFSL